MTSIKLATILLVVILFQFGWPTVSLAATPPSHGISPTAAIGYHQPNLAQTCSVVEVMVSQPKPENGRKFYSLEISISCPELVQQLLVIVLSGGTEVPAHCPGSITGDSCTLLNPSPSQRITLSAANFVNGEPHKVQIKAIGHDQEYILRPDEAYSGSDGREVLAETDSFKHNVSPIEFGVEFVQETSQTDTCGRVDQETRQLNIGLSVISGLERVATYTGLIEDQTTGQPVRGSEFSGPFSLTSLNIPLPGALQAAQEDGDYNVKVWLISEDGERIGPEQKEVKITPPKSPGLFRRAGCALSNYPMLLAMIVVVIGGASSVLLYSNRGGSPSQDSLPLPIRHTEVGPDEPPLRIKVTSYPGQTTPVDELSTPVPCLIGRHTGCDLHIPASQVSRRHARITKEGRKFFLTDLGSTNGTFIGERRLEPHVPVQLIGTTRVRLGEQTQLVIEVR
jgi:hypothetical protein